MKAAVCYESGKPLVVEDIDIDHPQKSEVKVRLAATAICHSDIHLIRGAAGKMFPVVAGHESAGYVEEVGERVTLVKLGDAVVISDLGSCGRCWYCTIGLPHLCEAFMSLRPGEIRIHNKKGQNITPMARVGGFAEYTIVDESQLGIIPEEMPLDRAALLGCGVITGFLGVINRVQVKALRSVVIIGTGGVGLNAVQGAFFSGAHPVIAVDVLDNKLEAAKIFGATHTINAKQKNAIEAVNELTRGRGADYVFVTGGGNETIRQGYAMTGPRGKLVLIALPPSAVDFPFTVMEFIRMEKTILGSFMGSTRMRFDIALLVELYQAGRLKLDELITARYPLSQINQAVESVERGEALRNVIMF